MWFTGLNGLGYLLGSPNTVANCGEGREESPDFHMA
jgi:hypothetical protein